MPRQHLDQIQWFGKSISHSFLTRSIHFRCVGQKKPANVNQLNLWRPQPNFHSSSHTPLPVNQHLHAENYTPWHHTVSPFMLIKECPTTAQPRSGCNIRQVHAGVKDRQTFCVKFTLVQSCTMRGFRYSCFRRHVLIINNTRPNFSSNQFSPTEGSASARGTWVTMFQLGHAVMTKHQHDTCHKSCRNYGYA